MKVLALEGSPRTKSFTDKLLGLFLEGMGPGAEGVTFKLSKMNIHPCIGCLDCWRKTPGACRFNDDMKHIYSPADEADLIILASPVYLGGFTSHMKMALDRLILIGDRFMLPDSEGHCRHERKIDKKQQMLLISTCNFPEIDNFDVIKMHFNAICKNLWTEPIGEILVSGSTLEQIPRFLEDKYELIRSAGREFAENGEISKELFAGISELAISNEEYREIANAFLRGGVWGNFRALSKSINAILKMRKPPKGA